jgi:hypothetical protein
MPKLAPKSAIERAAGARRRQAKIFPTRYARPHAKVIPGQGRRQIQAAKLKNLEKIQSVIVNARLIKAGEYLDSLARRVPNDPNKFS